MSEYLATKTPIEEYGLYSVNNPHMCLWTNDYEKYTVYHVESGITYGISNLLGPIIEGNYICGKSDKRYVLYYHGKVILESNFMEIEDCVRNVIVVRCDGKVYIVKYGIPVRASMLDGKIKFTLLTEELLISAKRASGKLLEILVISTDNLGILERNELEVCDFVRIGRMYRYSSYVLAEIVYTTVRYLRIDSKGDICEYYNLPEYLLGVLTPTEEKIISILKSKSHAVCMSVRSDSIVVKKLRTFSGCQVLKGLKIDGWCDTIGSRFIAKDTNGKLVCVTLI